MNLSAKRGASSLVLGGALVLASCGHVGAQSPAGTAVSTPGFSNGKAVPSASSAKSAFADPAATPRCSVSQIKIGLSSVGEVAGSIGGELDFTDISAKFCHLRGWPLLVGYTAQSGLSRRAKPVGSLFGWPEVAKAPLVLLVPGKPVHAAFVVADPAYGANCQAPFTSLRITIPGAQESISVSAELPALHRELPSCNNFAVTSIYSYSPFPTGATSGSVPVQNPPVSVSIPNSLAVCTVAQLSLSLVGTGEEMGLARGILEFTNRASTPCRMQGWPAVRALRAGAAPMVASSSFQGVLGSSASGDPVVELPGGGGVALAQVATPDYEFANPNGACPAPYSELVVSPPGASGSLSVSTAAPGWIGGLPDCGTVTVSAVVPFASVPYVADS